MHFATTSVLAVLPASAITLRTSAALSALHATLNASSQQDSLRNASTWGAILRAQGILCRSWKGVSEYPHLHLYQDRQLFE